MRHYTSKEWSAYAGGSLAEAERAAAEEHLYECNVCLQLYILCVEQMSSLMPTLSDADSFVLKVMRSVELEPVPRIAPDESPKPLRRRSVYSRPMFQYAVAAVITMLLMSAGVFREVSSGLETLESKSKALEDSSVSAKLMDKTVAFLDLIQSQDHGGMQK